MRRVTTLLLAFAMCTSVHAIGKLAGNSGGNEREVAVYSAKKGLEEWTITGPDGGYEFSLEPGEYMVSCGGTLAPYIKVVDGQTTWLSNSDQPDISLESELWTPPHISFGQTYTATGSQFCGMGFWMPQGSTKMKLTMREDGPQGKLVGEQTNDDEKNWFAGVGVDASKFPTTPGKVYYVELTSTEGKKWGMGTPRTPDTYPGGIAYYDGVPHPESDLGIGIWETRPGLLNIAAAADDQHFIAQGPGAGSCKVAGQTFIAKNGKNILSMSANCGFGGGVQDFIFSIYEGSDSKGKLVVSKKSRMVSDWGTTAYLLPDEVKLEEGKQYYFEYKRADGEAFYSYLSSDTYPDGKAYRDGTEVEGFDQMFTITGEVEPNGITFPYNIKVTDITDTSAKVTWETGTPTDGVVHYGDNQRIPMEITANRELSKGHSVVLTNLKPGTPYYFRVTSFTGKNGANRTWGRMFDFMTKPTGVDLPQFDKPAQINPVPSPGPRNAALVNGSFENGFKGWSRCSKAEPKESKDYPIGNGPFGSATPGTDGYKAYAGKMMYGWSHLGIDDPNPTLPREDWKQEVISQRIKVKPGHNYVLKGWFITGDRDSGWGRDSRIRLAVDTKDQGLLNNIDTAGDGNATQWFATRNEWTPVTLNFTAEKDTAVVGVHFLNWWALEANYLYVDDVSVEEVE